MSGANVPTLAAALQHARSILVLIHPQLGGARNFDHGLVIKKIEDAVRLADDALRGAIDRELDAYETPLPYIGEDGVMHADSADIAALAEALSIISRAMHSMGPASPAVIDRAIAWLTRPKANQTPASTLTASEIFPELREDGSAP